MLHAEEAHHGASAGLGQVLNTPSQERAADLQRAELLS